MRLARRQIRRSEMRHEHKNLHSCPPPYAVLIERDTAITHLEALGKGFGEVK